MTQNARIVLGSTPAEDDLRLPRAPGLVRAFWARHPVLADVGLVVLSLLFSGPTVVLNQVFDPPGPGQTALTVVYILVTCFVLLWRRRRPLLVYAVTFSPLVLLSPELSGAIIGISTPIAIYSVAVYRSNRAALWLLAGSVAGHAAVATAWWLLGPLPLGDAIASSVALTVMLLIGTLIGTNVGSRKRYVEALIERSRQLARERDQQAELAASAERTRIAREMHDIVSHSLAVMVTLAEGAQATDDAGKARQANRAIADTARDALDQMRIMLGVLRADPDDEHTQRAPLLGTAPDDIVSTAVAAGVPVSLTVTGVATGTDLQRLAVRRIVQEALTNAMRYAPDAETVQVVTDYTGPTIRVNVSNDGVPQGAASRGTASQGSGLGLQGLAERVTALGGTFSAGSPAPGRWLLHAEFPKTLEQGDTA